MLSSMFTVIAWAVAVSFLAFILAFFSEGRGAHLMRVALGLAPRKRGLEAFETVPRDEGDWRLLSVLEQPQRQSRPAPNFSNREDDAARRPGAPV